ncbi:MarR family transcriptional regulator [Macrococcus hajekii]|uniref:MarR family transcriptional regulator n=1 Tax=Macrococcus hajekii TaxID=198482 RepID=A0A4R6BJK4_9STAP|nr:MarR family transcriptional regulator [Macrococcus hajekii]TDM01889.1 MarR family transcriptional regulator [Macrococcus hajekii]GGB08306.1 MarR family transcriptional regulator [Macrococcus hajekii]
MDENQRFFDSILLIHRRYVEELNVMLSHYQLSTAQWLLFKTIKQMSPTTLVEVAKVRSIEKPTATKIIQRLIELKYIITAPGQDKREKILTLTPQGEQTYDEVMHKVKLIQSQSLESVDVSLVNIQLEPVIHYYHERKL